MNSAYMIIALRRISASKNENVGLEKACIRKIVKSNETIEITVNHLKKIIADEKGVWRIYRTVNKRDFDKARKILMKDLIDRPEDLSHKIDSHWKSILMKSNCKADKKFLVDIDTKQLETRENVLEALKSTTILESVETPNGFHFVTEVFDTRLLKDMEDVEIKKDELVFMEMFENE